MDLLIHPTYFPNIAHFVAMLQSEAVFFEQEDNYEKQTYRNRTAIYGANGLLHLSIPVEFTQKNRQKYKDVCIYNQEKWQLRHWRSIESAYRTSPFFEFYEEEIRPLFFSSVKYLLDFNWQCFLVLEEILQLDISPKKTTIYAKKSPAHTRDFRSFVRAKDRTTHSLDNYTQVFSQKHGFLSNLSILDLLFNEGPNTTLYLEQQILG